MSVTGKQVDLSFDSGFDEGTDDSQNGEEIDARQDDSEEDTMSEQSKEESSSDELRRIENDRYTSGTDSDDREKITEFFRNSDEEDESDSERSKKNVDEEFTILMDKIDNVLLRVMRKPKCFKGDKLYRSPKAPIYKTP